LCKIPAVRPRNWLLLAILVAAAPAHAGVDPYRLYLAQRGDIPWQSLNPEEQDALRRYQRNWDDYSGERQQRMRDGAQRYLDLPPDKRREVERQRREYEQLTPEQRRRLREEYRRERD
jgi:hypothetical protein